VSCSTSIISFSADVRVSVRLVYPSIFVTVAASQFAMSLVGVFAKWTQGIRDKEFLVELRLRNLDSPRKAEKVEPSAVESTGDQEEDEIGGEEDD
jgi:E3 ubiquitin-protein ligase MARCH6